MWALMVLGWILMITWLFISILLQDRNDLSKINNKFGRFIGWAIIYVGMIIAFYLFYQATMRLWASLILVGSILVGGLIVNAMRKKNVQNV